jgi:purine-nucleoside phosphorylase
VGTPSGAADPFAVAEQAARELVRRLGPPPEVALVLGSGWRPAANALGPAEVECPMADLPGFVAPTVPGHQGTLRSLRVGQRQVLVLLGRCHLYEGCSPAEVVHAVRTAVIAGASVVVLTNAAGAVNAALQPGQVVMVRDHLNLTGASPLSGDEPPSRYRSRFVDLTDLYASRLRHVASSVDPSLAEGVYAALPGPHYETPAEIVMLRSAGADLVGMSTALEAIAVRHLGASVLGLSLVTNLAAGVSSEPLDHAEVLAAGAAAVPRLGKLLGALLPRLPMGNGPGRDRAASSRPR